jgi:hypothetical protein
MTCDDCGKVLQGGFGVGEKPFKKFRCATCVIRNVENEHGSFMLGAFAEALAARPKLVGKRYKQYVVDTEATLRTLEAICRVMKTMEPSGVSQKTICDSTTGSSPVSAIA